MLRSPPSAQGAAPAGAPIDVTFRLPEAGIVTLVVEDAQGRRVRNLVAETPFPAGEHVAKWDGLDESGRIPRAMGGVVYEVAGKPVPPGTYRVRGLWRRALELRYEFCPYGAGSPPWNTPDASGGWLADHYPPSDVLFLPGEGERPDRMLISSLVAEAGHGLIWTDLDGRKLKGVRWIGGAWTGASHLARDAGAGVRGVYAYAGSGWKAGEKGVRELRISALTRDGEGREGSAKVLVHRFPARPLATDQGWDQEYSYLAGLAAHDGLVAVSLSRLDELLVVDARRKEIVSRAPLEDPRGLAFGHSGRLLALSGTRLVRFGAPLSRALEDGRPAVVIARGLQDPRRVIVADDGHIYVSDRGDSQQVKMFSPRGRLVRAVGKPGAVRAGPYDPARLTHPNGIAIDGRGRLWVAEEDCAPKCVSVWSRNGERVTEFLGPPQYGGGGNLSADKTRFYYYMAKNGSGGGMEFSLDWERGTSRLTNVYRRLQPGDWKLPAGLGYAGPQLPVRLGGRTYLTNAFCTNPTGGARLIGVWLLRDGSARLVAAAGSANAWAPAKTPDVRARLPEGTVLDPQWHRSHCVLFAWSDRNEDGEVQPDEVTFKRLSDRVGQRRLGTLYVGPALAMMTSFTDVLEPSGFTRGGVPLYDAATLRTRVQGIRHRFTSGGGEAFPARDGWIVVTGGPMRGYLHGERMWTYPSRWPGLHASHSGPRTSKPGQMIGTTRLLGWPVTPRRGEASELWFVNGNRGNVYVMTTDGVFVATLGTWPGPVLNMAEARRGMDLSGVNFHGEHFWPTVTQADDGNIYLVAGKDHSGIVRIDGLGSVRRLPATTLELSARQVAAARRYRQENRPPPRDASAPLPVRVLDHPPTVDGSTAEWRGAAWARIDERTRAAAAVARKRLYVAYETEESDLLDNRGESLSMLFKTGGALDLMLDARGGERLLVTMLRGKPTAVLYRLKVPGTPPERRVAFSSPTRTVVFDAVEDVSRHVELASENGHFEFSFSLRQLGLDPKPGKSIRADLGVLRGRQGQTTERAYWSNQATAIVTDVPSEAQLVPNAWGQWRFQKP